MLLLTKCGFKCKLAPADEYFGNRFTAAKVCFAATNICNSNSRFLVATASDSRQLYTYYHHQRVSSTLSTIICRCFGLSLRELDRLLR